jgi:hypothetical protein
VNRDKFQENARENADSSRAGDCRGHLFPRAHAAHLAVILALSGAFAGASAPAADATAASVTGNLLPNGDFAQADPANPHRPDHWDLPDGLGVQWLPAPAPATGHALRLDTAISEQDMVAQWRKVGLTQWDVPNPAKDPIAATYGLSYYSAPVPVAKDAWYRITYTFLGPAGGVKVWVRGYRRPDTADADPSTDSYAKLPRRLYECVANGDGVSAKPAAPGAHHDTPPDPQAATWRTMAMDFCPTRHTPNVDEVRVMLYAYWPPGAYWFRDVRLEAIPTPATAAAP